MAASPTATEGTLSPAQRSKIRRLATPREPDASDEAGELNIVPFLDIITNVMMFVLASISVSFVATLDTSAPHGPTSPGAGDVPNPSALNLTVLVGAEGYYVKGRGGSLAAGCEQLGTGVTIAMTSAAADESSTARKYDNGALQRCARTLKNELEEHGRQERQVIVSANPNVPFQEVVRAMDALRSDERGPLFPDVVFSVVK
ncbi:MAG: ExbD/TolR family protein [Polyangiales bacterium]